MNTGVSLLSRSTQVGEFVDDERVFAEVNTCEMLQMSGSVQRRGHSWLTDTENQCTGKTQQ